MLWLCSVGLLSCTWFSDQAIQGGADNRPFVWLFLLFGVGLFISLREV
jgi:hypothetical protein